jgi:hypothetical protein
VVRYGSGPKDRREAVEQASDVLGELRKQWENRFSIDNLAIAKRYLKYELRLVYLFHVRESGGHQLCAVFEREPSVSWPQQQLRSVLQNVFPFRPELGRQGEGAVGTADDEEEAVLVVRVESVKTPEGVVPSLVRLLFTDQAHRVLADALYASQASVFKVAAASTDREHGLIGRLSAVVQDELPDEMVERSPEVVDRIPDETTPLLRRVMADLDSPNSKLGFILTDDLVRPTVDERFDALYEIDDVLVGPIDLQPRPGESFVRTHALTSP